MKIIDSHIHFSNIEAFKKTAKELSMIDYSSQGLMEEFKKSGVVFAVAMGLTETAKGSFPDPSSFNPMGLDLEETIPQYVAYCIGINPERLKGPDKEKELQLIEEEAVKTNVIGIKIYAGYYPYYVYDQIYEPVYNIAKKHKLPVVIHTGDTYSERGLLKYSHPLAIDELAVSHRDINFIIAHVGDPWIMDAAEIIAKNPNVYGDLSGLIVGEDKEVNRFKNEPLFLDHIRRGLVFTDNYFKFLFGSDWPLVQIEPYIDFVKALVPQEFHEHVFYRNALRVFPKLEGLIKNSD